jgi:hypothetical protein
LFIERFVQYTSGNLSVGRHVCLADVYRRFGGTHSLPSYLSLLTKDGRWDSTHKVEAVFSFAPDNKMVNMKMTVDRGAYSLTRDPNCGGT